MIEAYLAYALIPLFLIILIALIYFGFLKPGKSKEPGKPT
jgi:hypothetical protein